MLGDVLGCIRDLCSRESASEHQGKRTPPITQTPPEIQRTGLAGVVLYLKSLPLDIDVLHFDYLDRPEVG